MRSNQRSMKCAWVCLFVAFAFTFLLVPGVFAQTSGSGAITGIITDPSAATVPNVTVTVTNTDTGQARTTMTGSDGSFTVGLLLPGTYKVRFEVAGFKPVEIPSVTVTVTETTAVNRRLEVASAAQSVVTVEAEAENNVDTTSSTMGTVVESKTVTDMPLSSRQYTDLLGLTAAGNASVLNATGLGKASVDTVVNGAGTGQNNYQMDGASINNFGSFQRVGESSLYPAFGVPAPDAVQEFKIQTSTYDASAGRNPGAVVNVVTKSGGNQFHGDAFEFFRNTSLNANDFFLNEKTGAARQRGVLNQNQYGGTLGGPIKKDKLFFFGSYQETGQKNGLGSTSISSPVLPPIPSTGIFATNRGNGLDATGIAFQQALGAAVCNTSIPQNKTVPVSGETMIAIGCTGANINPVAIKILQLKNPDGSFYIPSSGTTGYVTTPISIPSIYKEHQFVANWDYLLNGKNTLSGRWFRAESPVTTSFPGAGFVPDSGLTYAPTNHEAVLKLTTVATNNVVNEVRVSFQRNFLNDVPSMPFTTDEIGQTPASPGFGDKIGQFAITGGFSFGVSQFLWETNAVNQYQIADQISWTHEKHTVRVGFELERDQWNWQQPSLALGSTTIASFPDFLIGLPGCAPGTGPSSHGACNAANPGNTNGTDASNLGAISNTAELTTPSGNSHRFRSHDYSAFIQDDYKIFPRLTLNLGLRWEFDGNVSDPGGSNSSMWLSQILTVPIPGTSSSTGSLAGWVVPNNFPGSLPGGVTRNTQDIMSRNHTPLNNFAPRLGFAWQPTSSDRLALRGGAGYFYDRIAGDPLIHSFIENAPFGVSMGGTSTTNYFASLANPYPTTPIGFVPRFACLSANDPNLYAGAAPCAVGSSNSSNIAQGALAENFLTPLVYEWNLNLQYEFLSKWTLEVGYVGSRGIHQSVAYTGGGGGVPVNVARIVSPSNPAYLADGIVTTNTTSNASLRVPYLGLTPGFPVSATNGDYKFNGLQTTVRKAFSYGMTLQSTFAWSRSFMGDYVNSPYAEVYGPNVNYHPLRMSLSYAWTIPNGKLKGFLGKATNGWTVTGVTIIQDGTPLTPTDSRNCTIYGAGSFLSCTPTFAPGMGPANAGTSNLGGVTNRLGGSSGGPGYFNASAFYAINNTANSKPPAFPVALGGDGSVTGLGTAGQGYLLGPGQNNWDMSIGKITRVGGLREDATLLFRAEFFNSFNHPQFSNPTLTANSSSFGQITTMSVNPRILQLALKYTF